MKLTGAEMVVRTLEKNGVKIVFGYPGAANCPIIDRLSFSPIKHILTRNEQGAAHMASGYARVTKEVGVCTATSGPGATNLITGIATAYMDSIPMVALTGQVGTKLIGKDAFQEVDITGATLPFTKHSYLIKDGLEIPNVVNEAFHIAGTGRPGPVLIDFPMDILKQEFEYPDEETPITIRGYKLVGKANESQVRKVADAIKNAQHGNTCRRRNCNFRCGRRVQKINTGNGYSRSFDNDGYRRYAVIKSEILRNDRIARSKTCKSHT